MRFQLSPALPGMCGGRFAQLRPVPAARWVERAGGWLLGWLALFFCCSGASCMPRQPVTSGPLPPVVFQQTPDLETLAGVINRHRQLEQLQSRNVEIRMAGAPKLSASMVWQRERQFRMQGGVSQLFGKAFDLGSNDEQFWMLVNDMSTPVLYYANHADFEAQSERQVLPVSPLFLVEALGVVELRPEHQHRGPIPRSDGLVEIHSTIPYAAGEYRRILVLEPRQATVRRVVLYDHRGRMLAYADQQQHRFYPEWQLSLPHQVQIQLTPSSGPPLDMELQIGLYSINRIDGYDPERFQLPPHQGARFDLVHLPQMATARSQVGDFQPLAADASGYRPAQSRTAVVPARGLSGDAVLR
jgi:hypothetical protein